jgi:hypothetical protein
MCCASPAYPERNEEDIHGALQYAAEVIDEAQVFAHAKTSFVNISPCFYFILLLK